MSPADRPAADMRLFYLEGEGVLFAEPTQELHLLNPAATIIWSLLEEGHDADSAGAALREITGIDPAQSAQFVAIALGEWRNRGWLAGSAPPAPQAAPAAAAANPADDLPPMPRGAPAEEQHYRILGSAFRLRFSGKAQAELIRPIVEHLESPPSPEPGAAFDIVEVEGRQVVYRDGVGVAGCAALSELAPVVKSLVWAMAVNGHRYFLDIHAGVIGDGSRCILLPAAAGSGKSTLTAALVHAGYQFFSDEVALLEEGTLDVFPMPLAMCVKQPGIAALADRFPQLRACRVHDRIDGKKVAYMPPPAASLPDGNHARPVAALVFPRYQRDAATALLALPNGEALKRLLDECLVVPMGLDAKKVAALVEWIARIPCYSLSYGSTEGSLAAIKSVFETTVRHAAVSMHHA
jgi:hypothetical protein